MESSHDPDPAGHQVYLLTLWRETPNTPWRAALRLAGSEEPLGFANLLALARFLVRLNESGEHLATQTTPTTEATQEGSARTVER